MSIKWHEVTDRIRAMARVNSPEETREVAERLGVQEYILAEGLAGRSRIAVIKVIAALVRRGVDAKWMLTGEVDPALHRRMLESRENEIEDMIKQLLAQSSRPNGENSAIGPG